MREIKFRAWDRTFGEMIIDPYLGTINEDKDTSDLMQYIGLKDKNGKEIYEGDIVKREGNLYIVYWDQKHCRYDLETIIMKVKTSFGIQSIYLYEKIGNIHENQELLKEV